MDISKLLKNADDAYINYRYKCEALAKKAQQYIDWDDSVSCEHLPADGLCILATMSDDCGIYGMPECVCPADLFFSYVELKEAITPQEFKAISI